MMVHIRLSQGRDLYHGKEPTRTDLWQQGISHTRMTEQCRDVCFLLHSIPDEYLMYSQEALGPGQLVSCHQSPSVQDSLHS